MLKRGSYCRFMSLKMLGDGIEPGHICLMHHAFGLHEEDDTGHEEGYARDGQQNLVAPQRACAEFPRRAIGQETDHDCGGERHESEVDRGQREA